MNKKLAITLISLIIAMSLMLGIYVSSAYDTRTEANEEISATTDEDPGTGPASTEEPGSEPETETDEIQTDEPDTGTGEVVSTDEPDTGDTGTETETDEPDTGDTGTETETDGPVILEGIEFEEEVYRLHVGDSLQLIVKAVPEEAELPELSYYSSDDDKAEIGSDGTVTATGNGKVTITAASSGGEFTCSCTVIVSSSDVRFTVTDTGEKFLTGVTPGATVGAIVTDICTSEELAPEAVTVLNADGTEATSNLSYATGMVFSVDGVEYTAILYGDVNGDGLINSTDTQAVADYTTGKITLDRAFLKAADLKDDGIITIENALMIQRHIYGYKLIEQ